VIFGKKNDNFPPFFPPEFFFSEKQGGLPKTLLKDPQNGEALAFNFELGKEKPAKSVF